MVAEMVEDERMRGLDGSITYYLSPTIVLAIYDTHDEVFVYTIFVSRLIVELVAETCCVQYACLIAYGLWDMRLFTMYT